MQVAIPMDRMTRLILTAPLAVVFYFALPGVIGSGGTWGEKWREMGSGVRDEE